MLLLYRQRIYTNQVLLLVYKLSTGNALLGCSGARMVRLPWNTVTHGSYPYVDMDHGWICRICPRVHLSYRFVTLLLLLALLSLWLG